MNRSELRSVVFEVLRKTSQTHFRAVENDVRKRVDDYERRDVLALNEILWELLLQGVLAPGKNSLNPDLPFVHVTEYGSRCIEDEAILARDPDAYVERLREVSQDSVDPIALESARLGLLSFLGGRYEAALLLLAHAVDSVLGQLLAALIRSGRKAGRGTKRLEAIRAFSGRKSAAVHRALMERRPPEEIAAVAETQLAALEAVLRLTRSEKGTPIIPPDDRDLALARFLLFPDQCRFAYHAIRWLERKSST